MTNMKTTIYHSSNDNIWNINGIVKDLNGRIEQNVLRLSCVYVSQQGLVKDYVYVKPKYA